MPFRYLRSDKYVQQRRQKEADIEASKMLLDIFKERPALNELTSDEDN